MRRRTKTNNNDITTAIFNIGEKTPRTTPYNDETEAKPHKTITEHKNAKIPRLNARNGDAQKRGTLEAINHAYVIRDIGDTPGTILKGVQNGTDAKTLLLLAVQCIDKLRGTTALYDEIRNIYGTVYTDVFSDKNTAYIEREDALKRLEKLRQAEPPTADDRHRVQRAITEHEKLIARLTQIIDGDA